MERPFTRFVAASAGTLAPTHFDELWPQLRQALAREIRRRGLWQLPPVYLGIDGAAGWNDESALDQLVTEAFRFVFIDRLSSLKTQLGARSEVDGLVLSALGHFVHDRQKTCDPVGYRAWETLVLATGQAVREGRLVVLGESDDLVRDSVLAGRPNLMSTVQAMTALELEDMVERRLEDLMPVIFVANGPSRQASIGRLAESLGDTAAGRSLGFGELLDLFEEEIRARWVEAVGRDGVPTTDSDEGVRMARIAGALRSPDGLEGMAQYRASLAAWAQCLDAVVDGGLKQPTAWLWRFLLTVANDPEHGGLGPLCRIRVARFLDMSETDLSAALGILEAHGAAR